MSSGEDFTCFYVAEMIIAIESCHRHGFIHRDIKPDERLDVKVVVYVISIKIMILLINTPSASNSTDFVTKPRQPNWHLRNSRDRVYILGFILRSWTFFSVKEGYWKSDAFMGTKACFQKALVNVTGSPFSQYHVLAPLKSGIRSRLDTWNIHSIASMMFAAVGAWMVVRLSMCAPRSMAHSPLLEESNRLERECAHFHYSERGGRAHWETRALLWTPAYRLHVSYVPGIMGSATSLLPQLCEPFTPVLALYPPHSRPCINAQNSSTGKAFGLLPGPRKCNVNTADSRTSRGSSVGEVVIFAATRNREYRSNFKIVPPKAKRRTWHDGLHKNCSGKPGFHS
ncbi:hypothetical protein F5J12DRAFT_784391 [Pisolithus orientalis]|uniref:uncharacterized protein n=1 Tax=Pisolithus orientalis TaxID=936130 RepID=UPI002224C4B8|nr:uncharacterized protein F5J12DRAFT_784391 [Pisolithus orientalis]KAI6000379.1 hypothetical protein F5J12DRAFT_784391 [Pisolithus orientalis]